MNLHRFETLINHLESGVLGHSHFDFRVLNHFDGGRPKPGTNACGSAGCALGELPIIDPDNWDFCGSSLMYQHGSTRPFAGASEYFGIEYGDSLRLFSPVFVGDAPWYDKSNKSSNDPEQWTRFDVALHMKEYLAFVKV